MGLRVDLTGKTFGKLLVIKLSHRNKNSQSFWDCECKCGGSCVYRSDVLLKGNGVTCGKCTTNTFYEHPDGYMVGITSKGEEFYFDKEDYEKIKVHSWFTDKDGYITATGSVRMHRLLKPSDKGMQIDHINLNVYDNRKNNLRVSTQQENSRNRPKISRKCTSVYKGVHFNNKTSKWYAQIGINRKSCHIGTFSTEKEAAQAYNKKASEIFKEFALLNSIDEGDDCFGCT
jgi:hypothetical protein